MIEDTSKRPQIQHDLGIAVEGQSGYIRGMEAAGQRELLTSRKLPTDFRGSEEHLDELGFVLGPVDPDDPMFREVTLPEGWRHEGSAHDMWSHLIDRNGKRRAGIFYKAAWYDRSAHWDLVGIDVYVWHLLHTPDATVELDDEWATGDAVRDALVAEKARNASTRHLYQHTDSDYGAAVAPKELSRLSAEATRLDELLAQLPPNAAIAARSRAEHLEWTRERALAQLDSDEDQRGHVRALALLDEDLRAHPATAEHPALTAGTAELPRSAVVDTDSARRFVQAVR